MPRARSIAKRNGNGVMGVGWGWGKGMEREAARAHSVGNSAKIQLLEVMPSTATHLMALINICVKLT